MRPFFHGPLLVLGVTAALGPASAPALARGLSFHEVSDWYFAQCAGQEALAAGALVEASHQFHEAIRIAWPGAMTEPWPLARTYNDLALVLLLQGRPGEAEPLAEWSLSVREEYFGKNSLQAATTLHVLAQLASAQDQYPRCERLLKRALAIWQKRLDAGHPQIASGLNDLGTLYALQRKYDQAEAVFRRVLEVEASDSSNRAIALIGLGSIYSAEGQYELAEAFDQELLKLMAQMSPATYGEIAPTLARYLAQLRNLGRSDELATLSEAAEAARSGRPLPPDSPPRGTPPPLVRHRTRST